jgi:hypothetical protein
MVLEQVKKGKWLLIVVEADIDWSL